MLGCELGALSGVSGELFSTGSKATDPIGEFGLTGSSEPYEVVDTLTWVMLGGRAVLLAAGFVYDLSTVSTRDCFSLLQEACELGCTEGEYSAAEEVKYDIQTAPVVDGLLYGGAAVDLGVALRMLLMQDPGESTDSVTVIPCLGLNQSAIDIG